MKICGLQKLTALDFPGRVACTVFTPGCDYRCPFCHNAALVTSEPPAMDTEAFFAYLEKRRGILDGVAVTGGEPLLQRGLPDFLRRVKAMGFLTKLDTNGSLPHALRPLLEEGLVDYVAMDIKNSPAKYPVTCGLTEVDMAAVRESIGLIMASAADYEFRTTVVAQLHSDEDFAPMGEMIRGAKRWYLQNFVDSGGLIAGGLSAASPEDMRRYADLARAFVENVEIRGL